MTRKIKLIVVDDHPVVLQGFAYMLQHIPEFELLADFNEAKPAMAFIAREKPDVVLLDISLPDISGIEACNQIVKSNPAIKIIGISNSNEYSIIRRMLDAGASGYVLKNANAEEIRTCIHSAIAGKTGLSEEIDRLINHPKAKDTFPVLTHREQEVLELLAQGLNSYEIGEKIFISHLTVESYRKTLLKKFNASNVAALIYKASEMKYI
ncbi:response regulator [Parapedobacter koreensis]|uniref:Two component transcriptional regulator, LuxR family n=1 Tax=Parapedobacter koreensis TaxID=332977 RepID=A0A1H7SIT2_9SPHI|nr:response regulator transcription factor [Parapedobacter koreensis]SEL72423.1 two component transcriptional regulator, LuxR family [Parapedobacter koreensis]